MSELRSPAPESDFGTLFKAIADAVLNYTDLDVHGYVLNERLFDAVKRQAEEGLRFTGGERFAVGFGGLRVERSRYVPEHMATLMDRNWNAIGILDLMTGRIVRFSDRSALDDATQRAGHAIIRLGWQYDDTRARARRDS